MVGREPTLSELFILHKMVVLPAPFRPTTRLRTSFLNIEEIVNPIIQSKIFKSRRNE
jgi:hypothetical protein